MDTVKVECIKRYNDLKLNKKVFPGEVFEVEFERAYELVAAGAVQMIDTPVETKTTILSHSPNDDSVIGTGDIKTVTLTQSKPKTKRKTNAKKNKTNKKR